MFITFEIDLTKLPKDKIKEGSNGHKYIKLTATSLQQPDRFGNNITVFISQSKEERGKADRIYVGSGKTWEERKQVNDFPSELKF